MRILHSLRYLVLLALVLCSLGGWTAEGAERIELTLKECVDMALTENLDFRVARLGLNTDDLSIIQAESIFDPYVALDMSRAQSESPTFYQYYGVKTIDSRSTQANLTLGRKLTTGGSMGFGFYNSLSESNIETAKNYTSNLGINLNQPLLRGYGSKVSRSTIYLTRISRQATEYEIESNAMDLVYNVQRAYWDLVFTWKTLRVRELSLAQADSLLAYNRKAMELGVLTESDVLEAESMVLSRRQEILDQESRIRNAEDVLRRLLNLTSDSDWEMDIIPVDEPAIRPVDIDIDKAVSSARSLRPDYLIEKKRLDQYEFNRDLAKNSVLPSLNLSARYNINGSGTTYGKDISDMGDFQKYGWNVGLVMNYTLKNRDAKAALEKREIDIRRANLNLNNLESTITTQIRSSSRNVEILRESVDVARKNVEVDELKLKKEEERFRNKLSSSYYVLQFQRDLANSRNLYNRALIDYIMAVNDFNRARGMTLRDLNISIIGMQD